MGKFWPVTVARLNPDGSVHASFDPRTHSPPTAGLVTLVQSTGKRVVTQQSGQITDNTRYNLDGSIDTTFGDNGHVRA